MLITRNNPFTGKSNTLDINVTQEQLDNYYKGEASIQEALPFLTPDEREFIKTGITAESWNEIFN